MAELLEPSHAALLDDLQAPAFIDGVDAGRWRLVGIKWPTATFTITAGDGNEMAMRVDLSEYPARPPAGTPWDLYADAPLSAACLPKGPAAGQVFRSAWSAQQGHTPYMATERLALESHPGWPVKHPERTWTATRTISFYLGELFKELRSCQLPEITA